jgi:hypothetical protein
MKWIEAISREIVGLFVDDGSLAIAIVVWLGIAWLLAVYLMDWSGVVLFTGLVSILVENAVRRARR